MEVKSLRVLSEAQTGASPASARREVSVFVEAPNERGQ